MDTNDVGQSTWVRVRLEPVIAKGIGDTYHSTCSSDSYCKFRGESMQSQPHPCIDTVQLYLLVPRTPLTGIIVSSSTDVEGGASNVAPGITVPKVSVILPTVPTVSGFFEGAQLTKVDPMHTVDRARLDGGINVGSVTLVEGASPAIV